MLEKAFEAASAHIPFKPVHDSHTLFGQHRRRRHHHVFLHGDEAFHTQASVGCEMRVLSMLSP